MAERTVAVDFDGVIHPYTKGWTGPVPEDEPPMPGAQQFLERMRQRGHRVVIFSTRCDTEEGLAGVREWLRRWTLAHLVAQVTCQKPPAVAYVDDRAVAFRQPWGWEEVIQQVDDLAEGRSHGAPALGTAQPPPAEPIDPDRPCEHKQFISTVEVARLQRSAEDTTIAGFSADIRVECASCGERFRWLGGLPVGLMPDHPCLSADGYELRAPLAPGSADPDFGLGLGGFIVRERRSE